MSISTILTMIFSIVPLVQERQDVKNIDPKVSLIQGLNAVRETLTADGLARLKYNYYRMVDLVLKNFHNPEYSWLRSLQVTVSTCLSQAHKQVRIVGSHLKGQAVQNSKFLRNLFMSLVSTVAWAVSPTYAALMSGSYFTFYQVLCQYSSHGDKLAEFQPVFAFLSSVGVILVWFAKFLIAQLA